MSFWMSFTFHATIIRGGQPNKRTFVYSLSCFWKRNDYWFSLHAQLLSSWICLDFQFLGHIKSNKIQIFCKISDSFFYHLQDFTTVLVERDWGCVWWLSYHLMNRRRKKTTELKMFLWRFLRKNSVIIF